MSILTAIINGFKAIAMLLGLIRETQERAAGAAMQRDADDKAMAEGRRVAKEVREQAATKHAADPTDDAFDRDFERKEV